jgi:UDP-N-acetylmuramate--alanine ligase
MPCWNLYSEGKTIEMLLDKKHIHFIGVGGIGMSGLADILLERGYRVSGSDVELNNLTAKLEGLGGRIYKGHRAANIAADTDAVVYSTSITEDNPEIAEAKRRKLPVAQRAQILAELLNANNGIAVTGTHGKTTTTSLIAVMLENLKLDPTVVIGGEVELFNGNAKNGRGSYTVAEADESDASFIKYEPLYSVITNIEMEHVDHYNSLGAIMDAFRAYAKNTKKGGTIFYYRDDPNAVAVLGGIDRETMSYGNGKDADIYPADIRMDKFDTSYTCIYKGRALGEVKLKIPGRHNILNSLAAILVGLKMGFSFTDIAGAIRDFKGTKRRFHLRIDSGGVMLIDDYAHHPTEIRAVLDAARNWTGRRVIVIFQPHRYTRTLHLADEFGKCFNGVDKLILTEIYAASEEPIEGVSVKNIYDRVRSNGLSDVVIMKKEDIADNVMKLKRAGDMILVLGAGSIKDVANELSERLNTN